MTKDELHGPCKRTACIKLSVTKNESKQVMPDGTTITSRGARSDESYPEDINHEIVMHYSMRILSKILGHLERQNVFPITGLY